MDFTVLMVQRLKEPQSLYVVHVQVGKKNIDPGKVMGEAMAQSPDTGTRIQNQDGFRISNLYAGGISPINLCFRSGRRERSARAPDCNLHDFSDFQKIAMAPT